MRLGAGDRVQATPRRGGDSLHATAAAGRPLPNVMIVVDSIVAGLGAAVAEDGGILRR